VAPTRPAASSPTGTRTLIPAGSRTPSESPERVAWRVLDNYFDFTHDKNEWKDTEIHFEITAHDGKTEVRFTHVGLVPEYECFDVCSHSWDFYLHTSLRALIRTGRGCPTAKSKPYPPDPGNHRFNSRRKHR
jgi:hypothetical protein